MLRITIPAVNKAWDESKQEFVSMKEQTLQLEHSLVSLSKWESKWCKPFIGNENKTTEEIIDYIKCMTITQNVKPDVYNFLTKENIEQIEEYIDAPMTATTFSDDSDGVGPREIITSELIYYWMMHLDIPFECQKWHFNRLLTLIRVCKVKNAPPKKMSQTDLANRNRALNELRKKQLNTNG